MIVMFYQGGRSVCDVSSRLAKLYVMFCPVYQICFDVFTG